jgi:uncharacterized protein (DUF1015 family)
VPVLRAFRALRYAHAPASDISAVLCPPYDIIGPERHEALLARDPHNAVRLELPRPEPGGPPESRYRNAARALAEWRSAKVLVKDRVPTVTLHEMTFTGPDGAERRAMGLFTRVRLEPFGAGIRRHERTLTGPKEDRYALLKATGTNLSPVVLLHDADRARTRALLEVLTAGEPEATATTDDGVRHRVWVAAASSGRDADDGAGPAVDPATAAADELLAVVAASPLTIADGHHRYETALRYREERGKNRACESDPAWDHVFALLYHIDDAPPVLPTHRVLLRGPFGEELLRAFGDLFEVERLADPEAVLARMTGTPPPAGEPDATGTGRIGLVSGDVAAILTARPAAFAPLLDATWSAASRGLDVNRVAAAFERVGVDAAALAAGDRVRYVKNAAEAMALAVDGEAAATLLLDGPPVSAVTRVAAAGEVMPQKSTYFDPKAPTGLLFGPLEW